MSQARFSKKDNAAMNASNCGRPKCVQEGLKIFGDAWTLFIVSSLADGDKRFCELQRLLNNVNPVTLSSRLKKLEKFGFVQRKEELIDGLSVSYSLTKKGSGMLPVLHEIESYAKKYLED